MLPRQYTTKQDDTDEVAILAAQLTQSPSSSPEKGKSTTGEGRPPSFSGSPLLTGNGARGSSTPLSTTQSGDGSRMPDLIGQVPTPGLARSGFSGSSFSLAGMGQLSNGGGDSFTSFGVPATLPFSTSSYLPGDSEFVPHETVVQRNGQVRQAGATIAGDEWTQRYKARAEQSLFVFLKGVLGRYFLTPHFHRDVCHFVEKCPPFRKLVLLPRFHTKTAIVSGGLPLHILIQPITSNIYFPGLDGCECRILLGGETETMAKKNLRVLASTMEENKLFRAFWPERCWENVRQARQWSSEALIIPRKNEWPDPTVRAVGVGGAITGARPNVMIKDDLISLAAANSSVVMEAAIEWHKVSRALLDTYEVESGLQSLEFIIGTRWAVYDLYSEIIDHDPSVEVIDSAYHQIIRDGKILWPEKHTLADIEQLRTEYGAMFYLLFMNNASDPELTDFDMTQVRDFEIVNGEVRFEEDERDALLAKRMEGKERVEGVVPPLPMMQKGQTLNAILMQRFAEACGAGLRLRG